MSEYMNDDEHKEFMFKYAVMGLLSDNHPAELERLTRVDDKKCKQAVHEIYLKDFGLNTVDDWYVEHVGDYCVLFAKTVSCEWIDEDGEYRAFDRESEALEYLFKYLEKYNAENPVEMHYDRIS
jgi:hypothetical protein